MADPRFFTVAGPFTLAALAEISKATPSDGADQAASYQDVAPLEVAGPGEVSFLDNKKYVAAFQASRAGLCVVAPEMADKAPPGMALLLSSDPYRAYARIAQAFYPSVAPEAWIAPTAWVDASAKLGQGCRVEPGAVIGAGAEIGDRCRIGANVVIGPGVVLGEDCILGANATISHALVGRRVNIYPGARIGQDGFGFAMGAEGHLKVPQLGRVVIGNGVEIGANTTIDRGAGPDTVIGDGCMIDNLVQIGHNVQLGRGCVIVAQVGISGSTRLGDFAAAGGQAGITGHLKIGAGARIAAQAGVMRDIPPGETVGGAPAVPMADWLRQSALLAKMGRKKT
ncbi:UDP-3-O-(3-hydroxymyristoyl)glucosamine N-acyltransferase [Paramagnetospirillum kuznetsovii]|uniref:UDP-3-O-acylglucosamine N-acyltransferase n=1 Tax=Paramagnetospirillum kuznetsovii TaxID=2053833 RepID=A0A364NZQ7_9PROT|nr:UDP-3-O-(3-hydroxymyristoyl)glucosamine N-acyltransferase [Paramagnetospirillum kuznetsovii]RAU22571.1 UDP-3-O-(3-hydroxymyristoyl)glucosamine N-acyltransferase [Paramagnetospirillum kuznetsovii]